MVYLGPDRFGKCFDEYFFAGPRCPEQPGWPVLQVALRGGWRCARRSSRGSRRRPARAADAVPARRDPVHPRAQRQPGHRIRHLAQSRTAAASTAASTATPGPRTSSWATAPGRISRPRSWSRRTRPQLLRGELAETPLATARGRFERRDRLLPARRTEVSSSPAAAWRYSQSSATRSW